MAFGFDLDSIVAKLGESPIVANAMAQFTEVRNGIIQAMNHFNNRFDTLEQKVNFNGQKLDRVIAILENPSDIRPAATDGLMQLLAESGEEMQILTPEPLVPAAPNGDVSIIRQIDEIERKAV